MNDDVTELKRLVDMAAGREPADLLIVNAKVVDVFTGTVRESPVSVGRGRFLGFSPIPARETLDAGGAYLLPGLIDAHIHIESSMASPARFAELVLPCGTTTVIADPHEIANVFGADGIRYMLESGRDLPLDIRIALPSCVPAAPFEDAGAVLDAAALEAFIDDPRVSGIGEVMNFPGVIAGDPDMLTKILLGLRRNKAVDGHAPGVLGRDLDAYFVTGVSNNHEIATPEELEQNLQRGAYALLREGSAARDLAKLLPALGPAAFRRCAFCCDDRHPEDILRDGHIDNHLRQAVRLGVDPVQAVTMGTLNAAECFGLRRKGAVAPGRDADFVLVDDLHDFRPRRVYAAGRLVAEDGRVLVPLRDTPPARTEGSGRFDGGMRMAPLADDAFALRIPAGAARVIGIEPRSLVTRHEIRSVVTDGDGFFHCADNPGLCKIAVIERHRATGRLGVGLLSGYGIRGGAVATSIAHDSHNVVTAGDNDADMLLAVRALAEMDGGIVMVCGGTITGRLPLPVAGLLTTAPPAETGRTLGRMIAAAHADLAIPAEVEPFMTLSFMALPVIPSLKITARGLFDVERFAFVETAAEAPLPV